MANPTPPDPASTRPGVPSDEEGPVSLLGLTPGEMEKVLGAVGGRPTQARNFMRGLHRFRPARIEEIPDVARSLLAAVARRARIDPLRVVEVQVSASSPGTRKILLETGDGLPVESVLFPGRADRRKLTLCLSSQAGCRMACSFCATGAMGFRRHLRPGEIIGQVWAALDLLEESERLRGAVFMGMGEPLDNPEAVFGAIEILHDHRGFNLAYDRICVSTAGVVPGLVALRRRFKPVSLALSLHATRDPLRDELVPLNRRYPIAEVLGVLRDHPLRSTKAFCIEYCLLAGVNDSDREAAELVDLLGGLPHMLHLIPYNPVPGLPYRTPAADRVAAFARAVAARGGACVVRDSRGPDILAACGQLGAAHARRFQGSPTASVEAVDATVKVGERERGGFPGGRPAAASPRRG